MSSESLIGLLSRQAEGDDTPSPTHDSNPVVAFIIGFGIIILASILNAAGLNLTKLDHVRTSAIAKSARRKDWLRPLWLIGMILYIVSQLIGSTLALDYMRAEYVAPLGSTSLIFNFLFSSLLIGSPVTSNDIYGTIIVIIGVIGIVAFGSINSGLASETDAEHLTYLWRRGGWLSYFFLMAISLVCTYIFTNELETVLSARSDLSAEPFAGMSARRPQIPGNSIVIKVRNHVENFLMWLREKLDIWTAPHEDKQIAWTLGIGFACCGGGLAGLSLVFAKAAVKLITGSLSHENQGNQFWHAASLFTFLFLAVTAVFQIICLNRGLRVYDSTLVVPVFYGVYTATGFLDSLIFSDSVDAYETWVLFLIFISIMVLISGVVLLTLKKPETKDATPTTPAIPGSARPRPRSATIDSKSGDHDESTALRGEDRDRLGVEDETWQVGDDSDDDDSGSAYGGRRSPRSPRSPLGSVLDLVRPREQEHPGPEGVGLMHADDADEDEHEDRIERLADRRRSTSSDGTLAGGSGTHTGSEEFGRWN